MAHAGSGPLRVYIADDSGPVAEMLTELISEAGRVEVVGVAGTEQGTIDAIRRLRPDVVLLDLELEDGSGTNVLRAVRGDAGLRGVRLVVLSNHVSDHMRAGCLALGADEYYDKVKQLGELNASLDRLA